MGFGLGDRIYHVLNHDFCLISIDDCFSIFSHHLPEDGVETAVERPREGGGERLDRDDHSLP